MDDPSRRWVGREPKPYLGPAIERFLSAPQLAEPNPSAYDVPRRLRKRRCRGCGRPGLITARRVTYGHAANGVNCPGSYKPPARRRALPRSFTGWFLVALVMIAAAAIGRLALRIF